MIGAIVLAAGSSRRFGDDKRQALLPNGRTVLQQSIENAAAVFDEVLVVLRYGDTEFEQQLNELFPEVRTFKAPESALGMGHSLANAISEVDEWEGAFVCLGDMPFIQRATMRELIEEFRSAEGSIVVPVCDGKQGHPVGFHSDYFIEIRKLSGDKGARSVLSSHEDALISFKTKDTGVIRDVDNPEDITESAR